MNKIALALAAAALAALPATPALAGWKLVEQGKATTVAKSSMSVTPGEAWNRGSVRPIKTSEIWTLDGVNLNEVYFVGGLAAGGTLYRDVKKKDQPLPKFKAGMELTEIPEFVESSTRLALNTSVFEMTSVEPTTFGGQPAVRFMYQYAVEGSPLKRRGLGVGTVVSGKLHLVTYTAPALYFFERDLPKVEAMIASATI